MRKLRGFFIAKIIKIAIIMSDSTWQAGINPSTVYRRLISKNRYC